MDIELVKIESYVPRVVAEKLLSHQHRYGLESLAQTAAAVLAEFFALESLQPRLQPDSAPTLFDRMTHLETVVNQLVQHCANSHPEAAPPYLPRYSPQLPLLTTQPPALSLEEQFVERGGENSKAETEHDSQTRTAHSALWVSRPNPDARRQALCLKLRPEDWQTGITTGDLVARLRTTPHTLKKYLRDRQQLQWARARDPEGLAWQYDRLLQRYYPVQAQDKAPDAADSEIATVPSAQVSGLTQSQLSRLTGISIGALQQWKDLPECTEKIYSRTEGRFSYRYSPFNKRFYPVDRHPLPS